MNKEDWFFTMQEKLPHSWLEVKFTDITWLITCGVAKKPNYVEKGIPFLSAQNSKPFKANLNDIKYISEEDFKKFTVGGKPEKNDVLYSRVGAKFGEAAKVTFEFNFAIYVSLTLIKPIHSLVDSDYLVAFLNSIYGNIQAHGGIWGSGIQNLNVNRVRLYRIPLAPLNEQRRLVTKIEALKTRSQRVKDALSSIPALLDQFRQSVLAAAFSGALTADWREKNPDVEPAEVLLEKIRLERGKRYQEECSKAELQGRRKPASFKENLEPIELPNLPIIPDTWCWERLANISNTIGGVTKGRKLGNRQTIMLPYLRVANVQDGYLDLSEIKEIEVLPEDLEKYHLEYGDILFTEGGDRDKLGRGTIWKNNVEKCIHQNHVYRARLYYSGVSCEYISLVTKSKYAKAYFFANASQTVNLASINLTCLGNLPLPIPSEEEQKEIVHQIKLLFKVADTIEQQYQQSFGAINQLDQSILAEAFRGALVPQDPNDEPASVLLERIRAERDKLQTKTAKKSTPKTSGRSKKSQPQQEESVQLELGLE